MLYYNFQELFSLTPTEASELYFAGFGFVVLGYVLGWSIRMAVQLIKSL